MLQQRGAQVHFVSSAIKPKDDAETFNKVLQGAGKWGDEEMTSLLSILCSRTNEQLQRVREDYQTAYNTDLVDAIRNKSKVTGPFEFSLIGLVLTRAQFDAKCVMQAMGDDSGAVDEQVLVDHLCHRSTEEINDISAAYSETYGMTLADALEKNLSGEAKEVFTALATTERMSENPDAEQLGKDAEALHTVAKLAATEGSGDAHAVTTRTLARYGSKLPQLNSEYQKRYNDNLLSLAKSGNTSTGKVIKALMCDADDYYAEAIHQSIDKKTNDTDRLLRILCSRRHVLSGIITDYLAKAHKALHKRVTEDYSGDLKRVLMAMTSNV